MAVALIDDAGPASNGMGSPDDQPIKLSPSLSLSSPKHSSVQQFPQDTSHPCPTSPTVEELSEELEAERRRTVHTEELLEHTARVGQFLLHQNEELHDQVRHLSFDGGEGAEIEFARNSPIELEKLLQEKHDLEQEVENMRENLRIMEADRDQLRGNERILQEQLEDLEAHVDLNTRRENCSQDNQISPTHRASSVPISEESEEVKLLEDLQRVKQQHVDSEARCLQLEDEVTSLRAQVGELQYKMKNSWPTFFCWRN